AYKMTEIKALTFTDTFAKPLDFKGKMGYLKNQSAKPISISLVNPNAPGQHTDWGVPAVDAELTIAPGEVIGPLFLTSLYVKVSEPGEKQLLVIIQEVR
ncbi:MAG: hypothetical protein ACRCX2_29865, partial [Paraclostridium sp.]